MAHRQIDRWHPSENADPASLDLSVWPPLLEIHDPLYRSRCCRSGISLVSSFISKDLVDIITGHQTGELLRTFAAMIGFSMVNVIVAQATSYASTFINLKVDAEIKNDIFSKILVTDRESLTA